MKRPALLPLVFLGCLFSFAAAAQVEFARFVMPADVLLAPAARAEAPAAASTPQVLHGVVRDQRGVLPGATVWLRGTTRVAVANAEGVFALPVPADFTAAQVTCSYAGRRSETATLDLSPPSDDMTTVYLRYPEVLMSRTVFARPRRLTRRARLARRAAQLACALPSRQPTASAVSSGRRQAF